MGRPLSKQQLFGANANTNIKVQFHNGTASVKGYIVRQRSFNRFLCKDVNGVTAICKIVDKESASLAAGEMSITVKFDDGTVRQVVKISRHLVTVNYGGSYSQHGWTFDPSTTDGLWQIEEAGTNAAMTSAVDLELDDDPNGDYPVPGSGTWQIASVGLNGVSYALRGTAAAVTGGITTVPNSAAGLFRSKYAGHYVPAMGGIPATWIANFFTTTPLVRTIADTWVSWGQQTDTTAQQNFSMEFKGYVKVPTTQNYNFYAAVDDDCAVWIGSNALPANLTVNNTLMYGSNQGMPGSSIVNTNSMTMDSTKWYPVRIWMTEFTGASKFQIFAIGADGTKYTGHDLTWAYNTATGGY